MSRVREHLHEPIKMPFFNSNFGPACSKLRSFSAENRPFLSSCKRSLEYINVTVCLWSYFLMKL